MLERSLLEQVKPFLSGIKPRKAVFDKNYVKKLDGTNVKKGKNKMELAEQLRQDIREFKRSSGADRLVMISSVLLALGMLAFYLLLRQRLDRSLLRRFLILLVFASMLPQQLTDFDGEIFTALLVLIGATLVVQRRGKIGWPLIVLGTVNAPASLVGLGLLSLTRIWSTHRLRYIVVPLLAAVLIGLEDWLRRGNPLNSGYNNSDGNTGFRTLMPYSGLPGFSYPLFFGLLSILFSFGKGLVFYMPGLFLFFPVRTRLRSLGKAGQQMYAT